MKNFKDLVAWQRSVDLAVQIYGITNSFPRAERYGLIAQMRGAAVSVPSNIAEGQGRITAGETLQFLGHARGSLNELATQALIAQRLGFMTPEQSAAIESSFQRVGSALSGFTKYIRAQLPRRSTPPNNPTT